MWWRFRGIGGVAATITVKGHIPMFRPTAVRTYDGDPVRYNIKRMVKVKWSRYRLGVAQRVGRGIALLFHDRGTRRGWVVSSTPRPHFTPGKDTVPILQEAGWAPGPVWTGGKSHPHRDSIPDRPARIQSLYRLSYPAHIQRIKTNKLRGLSPHANYTDRAAAAGRRRFRELNLPKSHFSQHQSQ